MKNKSRDSSLAVVIVTYNRLSDLKKTLQAFLEISNDFSYIIVINNASTDGTSTFLENIAYEFKNKMLVKNMDFNSGGAGGFHEGVKLAMELDVEWIWMSDDDAMPNGNTLKQLHKIEKNINNVYGSTAIAATSTENQLCWPYTPLHVKKTTNIPLRKKHADMPDVEELDFIPFLGLMISRNLVEKVGLPNKAYFISGDDVEYCIRAKSKGAKCIIVKDSTIHHPTIPFYMKTVLSYQFRCLILQPWRRRYDVRNRIWNAKLKSGNFLAILVTLSLFLRLFFTLTHEKNKLEQAKSYLSGIFQGLFNYQETGNQKGIFK